MGQPTMEIGLSEFAVVLQEKRLLPLNDGRRAVTYVTTRGEPAPPRVSGTVGTTATDPNLKRFHFQLKTDEERQEFEALVKQHDVQVERVEGRSL